MTRKVKFIEGVRVNCPNCKKQVTPMLFIESSDNTGETIHIDAQCPDCNNVVRRFQ